MTAVGARTENGVVVLGMHRSGTSATARAINLLGVPLCREDDLWRELPGNPTGYWESASLTGFNETLLRRIGSAWWCPPRAGEIDHMLYDDETRGHGERLFRSLYATPTWVWKDPRTCITLPFWRSVLDARLSCVLVLRNPLEVADSLAARDGIALAWALALWERYLRLAVENVAGMRVLITEFSQLLDAPDDWSQRTADYLGQRGIATDPARAGVDAFVQTELRHTAYGDADLGSWRGVSPEQRELHRIARALVGAWDAFDAPTLPPESAGTGELLDALRDRFPLNRLPAGEAVDSLLRRTPSLPVESETAVSATESTSTTTSGALQPEWREWVAENLLLQVPQEQVLGVLLTLGLSQPEAQAEIDSVLADPCWQAGDRAAQRLRKLESVLDVHEALDGLDGRGFVVDRMGGLSRRDFLERYYARNRPVVMLGLTNGWPAHTEWTPERLKARLGDVEVEVQSDRDADELYELHSNEHKKQMRLGEFIDRITQGGAGNDLYLTANNHFFERSDTAVLLNDFTMPTEYLGFDSPPGTVFFWFGPGGTVTPMHHDIVNVLFIQVHGRKRIRLIPSLQTHRVYNSVGVYSDVDLTRPDYEQFPRFADATCLEVLVEPGDALFIPVGWWHHVEALDTSVSLSFTNFAFPNAYLWEHPSLDR